MLTKSESMRILKKRHDDRVQNFAFVLLQHQEELRFKVIIDTNIFLNFTLLAFNSYPHNLVTFETPNYTLYYTIHIQFNSLITPSVIYMSTLI